jgi:hypothetical protein
VPLPPKKKEIQGNSTNRPKRPKYGSVTKEKVGQLGLTGGGNECDPVLIDITDESSAEDDESETTAIDSVAVSVHKTTIPTVTSAKAPLTNNDEVSRATRHMHCADRCADLHRI